VTAVIPARDEEATIAAVVSGLRACLPGARVVVCDNGSHDQTAAIAAGLGAIVAVEPEAGYGRACTAGLAAVPCGTEVVLFLDGDGSDCLEDAPLLVQRVDDGANLVLGVRQGASVEPGSMTQAARLGNWLCGWLLWAGWGRRIHDLSPMKAVSFNHLRTLDQRERTYGWTIELLALALQGGWRIDEVPTGYRHRAGGRSKVSGDLRSSARAAVRILTTIARVRARTLDRRGARRLAWVLAALNLPVALAFVGTQWSRRGR
jgi:glycosyltransferase involved in cell wall biosynthesis